MIIPRAVDCHVHLRRGDMLRAVLPYTADTCCRAIVMPSGVPAMIDLPHLLSEYVAEVRSACGPFPRFEPHFACGVSALTVPDLVSEMVAAGAEFAKINFTRFDDPLEMLPTLKAFVDAGVRILIHGADRGLKHLPIIDEILRYLPVNALVLEHLHRAEEVEFCEARHLHATITPHHLCLADWHVSLRQAVNVVPVLGSPDDAAALRRAARGGGELFMFGSDSAPHPVWSTSPGLFNAPFALQWATRKMSATQAMWFTSGAACEFHGWDVSLETIAWED